MRIRGRAVPLLVTAIALAPAALAACGGGGDGGGGAAEGNAEAGKQVFADAGCGGCHTLAAAGATGTRAPNLDERKPSYERVVDQVTNGGKAMPAFKDRLSEQEIANVAAFVSESAGG